MKKEISNFIKAAKALPPSIAIDMQDPRGGHGTLFVYQRAGDVEFNFVTKLNKKSLCFKRYGSHH